jgi:hypothetical protein
MPSSLLGALDTDDVHYTCEIIGKHVQCHLGGDLPQALHQKVRSTHPHLERRERMLHGTRITEP